MLTFEECEKHGKEFTAIPLVREILSDMVTPLAFLAHTMEGNMRCFLLESADGSGNQGRYSFLGYDPLLRLRAKEGRVEVRQGGAVTVQEDGDVSAVIREVLAGYKVPRIEGLPPFTGGLVGYFAYDYIACFEPSLKLTAKDDLELPDYDLMLFDCVIAFDRLKQKLFLISHMDPKEGKAGYNRAVRKLDEMENYLMEATPRLPVQKVKLGEFKSNMTKEHYLDMVRRTKEYIRQGDIFQAVMSQRFSAAYEGSLLEAYRQLRVINPSEYMFYLRNEEVEIAGASPETLVKVQDRHIMNLPIAGTRKRGATPEEDELLEQELLADEKEQAEHTMLVDLGRNDVGRVSRFGSVRLSRFMKIARFSHVMHIVSQVEGDLADDKDSLEALGAILPAGTLSGAPKLRACEIIDELEPNKRGFYGGGLGYIDFSGNMDVCITIRSIIKKNGIAHIQSGGGIVADSVPENEFQESINKAMAMMKAIERVKGEA